MSRPRTRLPERIFVGLFVVANLAVPLVAEELYPFSRFALFPDAGQVVATYDARTPEGRTVPSEFLGLRLRYYGLRGYSAVTPEPHPGGVPGPPAFNRFGEVASDEALVAHVRDRLQTLPHPQTVIVTRRILGDVGGGRVGVRDERDFTISNRGPTASERGPTP